MVVIEPRVHPRVEVEVGEARYAATPVFLQGHAAAVVMDRVPATEKHRVRLVLGWDDGSATCLDALVRSVHANGQVGEHPDKKVCLPSLPVKNQVTLKLTVDSAYQQDTAIQVDATSNDLVLLRVDKQSCTDIAIFGSAPPDIGMIKPIP